MVDMKTIYTFIGDYGEIWADENGHIIRKKLLNDAYADIIKFNLNDLTVPIYFDMHIQENKIFYTCTADISRVGAWLVNEYYLDPSTHFADRKQITWDATDYRGDEYTFANDEIRKLKHSD